MPAANSDWAPFRLKNEDFDRADAHAVKVVDLRLTHHRDADRGRAWLRNAMIALAILAAAAATVSWDAQYVMVGHVKHNPAMAALEAGIPDVGALIFAALGIALALHGKRALRARTLNVARDHPPDETALKRSSLPRPATPKLDSVGDLGRCGLADGSP